MYEHHVGKVEGGMNWEIGIDMYMQLYIKQITNENALFSTGASTQHSGNMHGKKIQNDEYMYMFT